MPVSMHHAHVSGKNYKPRVGTNILQTVPSTDMHGTQGTLN